MQPTFREILHMMPVFWKMHVPYVQINSEYTIWTERKLFVLHQNHGDLTDM